MTSDNAIILSMHEGDSLFVLKDPGIYFQKINTGPLLNKIIIWTDKNMLKTEENIIAYFFANDELDYGHISFTGSIYGNITAIHAARIGPSYTTLQKQNCEFMYTKLKESQNRERWNHYIFIDLSLKEEEK